MIKSDELSAIRKRVLSYDDPDARALLAEVDNLRAVLKEIAAYNPIHNDLEAYIDNLIEWALGETQKRPSAEAFGLPPQEGSVT